MTRDHVTHQHPHDWDEPVVIPDVLPGFGCVLVPFDGSPPAERALAYAEIVARIAGGEIVVVVAFDPPVAVRRRGILMVEQARVEMEEDARELAEESVHLLRERGSRARGLVVRGDIVPGILEAAADERADVIVMGRRGLSTLEGMLLGSVSERVARHTHVPVLLVG